MAAESDADAGPAAVDVVAADPEVAAAVRTAIARLGLGPDTRPPAYASAWRIAGLNEAAGLVFLAEPAAANGRPARLRPAEHETPAVDTVSRGSQPPGTASPGTASS